MTLLWTTSILSLQKNKIFPSGGRSKVEINCTNYLLLFYIVKPWGYPISALTRRRKEAYIHFISPEGYTSSGGYILYFYPDFSMDQFFTSRPCRYHGNRYLKITFQGFYECFSLIR